MDLAYHKNSFFPRIFGLTPFILKEKRLKFNLWLSLPCAFNLFVFSTNIILILFKTDSVISNMAPLRKSMVVGQLLGGYVCVTVSILFPIIMYKKLRSVFILLSSSENDVTKSSVFPPYFFYDRKSKVAFAVFFVMTITRLLSYEKYVFMELVGFASIYWMQFLVGLVIFNFSGHISLMTSLVSVCRNSLFWVAKSPDGKTRRLEKIVQSVNKTINACFLYNTIIGFPILIFLVCALAQQVGSVQIIIEIFLKTERNKQDVLSMSVKAMSTSYFTINSFMIVSTCFQAVEEVKEFNSLLFQLMMDDKTKELSNNETLRLHVSLNREVVFTACGLFNLDYTLIHSMIAAATTYLVILIQFSGDSSAPTIIPPTVAPNETTIA